MGQAGLAFLSSLIWFGRLDGMRILGRLGVLWLGWLSILVHLRMRCGVNDGGFETFVDVDRVILKTGQHVVEHVHVGWG